MRPLFARWKDVRRGLGSPEKTLWLFDYDGTLAPLVLHPDESKMPADIRRQIRRLAARYPRHVGVLSGRPGKTLHRLVKVPGLIYGSVHGFEVRGNGFHFQRSVPASRLDRLQALARDLRPALAAVRGLWIENKRWTLVVHYRQVRRIDQRPLQRILRRVRTVARQAGFKIQEGWKVVEIFSDGTWNKGQAASWLRNRLKVRSVFYIGDDASDETVYRVLKPSDVSVNVGCSRTSRAAYCLRSQNEVSQLLRRIAIL